MLVKQTVGAFDTVILQGQDVDSLMQWLADNGYEQDPDAAPIFQQYLDEGYLFAAFRLTHDAQLDEIHPITFIFQESEPCIPLRLTRIAAADNMEVRSFFLGNARAAPTNYRHVLINLLNINWDTSDKNSSYQSALLQAVDEFGADGRAFVTEYAGSSNVVSSAFLKDSMWDSSAFETLEATQAIDLLTEQDFLECLPGDDCVFFHELIPGLLNKYLPVPDGLEADEFWGCLTCYEDLIDQNAWDSQGFADDLEARIIAPGFHADALLDTWPYLTRLYTRISPQEMIEDPVFHINPSLPDVDNDHIVARTIYTCLDFSRYIFEDGRVIYKWAGQSWFNLPDMPFAEQIQSVPLEGAPQVIANNTPEIDQLIADWHDANGLPPPPPTGTTGETDTGETNSDSDTDSGGADSSGTDTGLTGPSDSETAGPTGPIDSDSSTGNQEDQEGCGCQSTETGSGAALFLSAFVLGLRRRKKTAS